MSAAQTTVCEPISRFYLDLPAGALTGVYGALASVGAVISGNVITGNTARLEGTVPASTINAMQQQLPGLTEGAGGMECVHDHYAPRAGEHPTRQRSGVSPFDRANYLASLR